MAALGSEDWRNAIHAGVFSDGADRPSVPELPLLRETPRAKVRARVLDSLVERVRDVCREYSQRGAPRTHDSAGETPPQTKHKGEVGGSQNAAPRRSERRVGPATHNVVSPVPTRCHQLSPHISCAGCAITNHSESSRMSHLRKSPLYRRQGRPRPGGHDHQSRPQERRLNTGSRLYRAMLAPAAAPPGRPRVFPQAEKTNPGGSNLLW